MNMCHAGLLYHLEDVPTPVVYRMKMSEGLIAMHCSKQLFFPSIVGSSMQDHLKLGSTTVVGNVCNCLLCLFVGSVSLVHCNNIRQAQVHVLECGWHMFGYVCEQAKCIAAGIGS